MFFSNYGFACLIAQVDVCSCCRCCQDQISNESLVLQRRIWYQCAESKFTCNASRYFCHSIQGYWVNALSVPLAVPTNVTMQRQDAGKKPHCSCCSQAAACLPSTQKTHCHATAPESCEICCHCAQGNFAPASRAASRPMCKRCSC